MAKNTNKGQNRAKRFSTKYGMKKSEWTNLKIKLRKEGKGIEINKMVQSKIK